MKQGKKDQKYLILVFLLFFFLTLLSLTSRPTPTLEASTSKHFVLVHGGCHGAWSWYKVMALLESWGHKVTALDMAASGVNQRQPMELHSISEYFKPLTEFMASLGADERVVLVGHSLGGLAISHAMEHFPHKIAVAVFVTALMPGPTLNVSTIYQEASKRQGPSMDNHYTYDDGPNNPPTTIVFGANYLASYLYQLSPRRDWDLATTLVRPLRLFSEQDMTKVLILSHTRYGSVSRVFVVSLKDRVGDADFQQWMITHNPPNCMVEISGSDHMIMMSKPKDLCLHLQTIATDYD